MGARAKRQAWLVTDMPFGSYEASPQQAFESAAALMRPGTALSDPEQVAALLPQVQVSTLGAASAGQT